MGVPFYTRTRNYINDVTPPGVSADSLNEYEAAHQAASDRVVGLESGAPLDARYGVAVHAVGNSGAALTLDAAAAAGNVKTITLTANCAFTLTGAVAGKVATLELVISQDGTGGRTVSWATPVKWDQGIVPVLAAAAGAVSRIVLTSYDGGPWLGAAAGKGFA